MLFTRDLYLRLTGTALCTAASLSVIALVGNGVLAQEPAGSELQWSPVDPSKRSEVLEMLALQTKGNYERIRTWTGKYTVQQELVVAEQSAANALSGVPEGSGDLVQSVGFSMEFAIDFASNAIFRSKEESTLNWLKKGSGEIVRIPGVMPADERSVVTAEHYLHFNAMAVMPELSVLPDHPEARGKRVAYRDPTQNAERQELGDLMDPRLFYGFGSVRKFWDDLSFIGKNVSEFGEALGIDQAAGSGGTWYRLRKGPRPSSRPGTSYTSMTWSAAVGFNAVSLVMSMDESGERPRKVMRWRWKQFGGIYVPAEIDQSNFDSRTHERTYHRTVMLTECAVNSPIAPEQFSYQGIGVADGDLVLDNIDKVVHVIRGGEPVKLADFNEEYESPDESGGLGPAVRWFLTIAGIVALIAIVLLVRTQRAKT